MRTLLRLLITASLVCGPVGAQVGASDPPEPRPDGRRADARACGVSAPQEHACGSGGRRDPRVGRGQAIGGAEIASRDACVRCHRDGGAAPAFDTMRVRRDAAWIEAHAADPEAIAPGARTPPPGLSLQERRAVAAWARAVRSAVPAPAHDEADRRALAVIGTQCLGCHVLDGDGRGDAPNLSRGGKERDAAWLAAWITDPTAFEYDTDMPAFGNKLSRGQIESVARHLARRR